MALTENEMKKRLILADASFLTASEKNLLQKKLDSSAALALMSKEELSTILGRDLNRAVWSPQSALKKAEKSLYLIQRLGIHYSFYEDEDFPAMLKEMADPPYVLFYRGSLECLKAECISVVGTRHATYTGKNASAEFGKDASDNGCTVVSGLAYGIDIASHRGALKGGSEKTAAVLPGGIDTIVPEAHVKTAASIIEKGGIVLSEYTPGTPAVNFRFVQRNRIIAALSPATVVIQAPAGSGSMITASLALDYNRYVFFHEACFNSESLALKKAAEMNLKALSCEGPAGAKKAKSKLFNSPERYVEDGAVIIKNYAEYCKFKNQDFCGINILNNGQMNLFG